jgi:hypothetical protein
MAPLLLGTTTHPNTGTATIAYDVNSNVLSRVTRVSQMTLPQYPIQSRLR